jgi:hypothetical protein
MAKDPFGEDDDDKEKVVKDATDDDGDDGEVTMERDAAGKEVAVVSTRAQKKRERGNMREENERLRRENEENRVRLARLEGAFMARNNVRDATDEDDGDDDDADFDERYSQLQRQHTDAYKALIAKGQSVTQADKDEYQKLSARIERQRIEMTAERLIERRAGQQAQQTAQDVMRAAIRARNADVYAKPAAVLYAEGEFRKLRAMGKPDSQETLDMAMGAARRAFGMTKEPAPTESQRARFAGPPRGQTSASGNGGGTIRMTPELRRMANAKYSHIKDEEKRYKMWANKEGRALLGDDKD